MKTIKIIALAITLLSACKKDMDEISPNASGRTDLTSNNKIPRPITRPFEIIFATTTDANSSPTPCSGDLPGFAIGGLFLNGSASHMGGVNAAQSTLSHVSCNLSFATTLLTTSIAGQMAAANGDLVFYTGNDEINVYNLLTSSGTTGPVTGVWTITGGTGRFAGATGSFAINGTADFITSTFSGTGVGTITY